MTGVERRGAYALLPVPHPLAMDTYTDDEILTAMHTYEAATAALAGLSATAAGILAQRRRAAALAEAGPDASRTVQERFLTEAQAAVVDEIRLATGLNLPDATARVDLGRSPHARAGQIRTALTGGQCSWAMARAWTQATADVPADVADDIARYCLRPRRDGTALTYALFRDRLSARLLAHRGGAAQRDYDLDRRDAYATLTPHGTGEITVSGAAERIQAAIDRIDTLARTIRRGGDGRTLAQLRSDIALDLIIFGDIPALGTPLPTSTVVGTPRTTSNPEATPAENTTGQDSTGEACPATPAWVRYFPGGLPPALLWVVVSAATLAELSDDPGTLANGTALPADAVRDLAFAAGSTWRRLVTDPITGEALELSTTSYTPPPRLREAIQARDGTCRAPGSRIPASRCDLDHNTPWPAGPTTADNLAAKSRRAHLHKTRGQWASRQLPDGTIVWTMGTGREYTTYPRQYDQNAPGRPHPDGDTSPSTSPLADLSTAPVNDQPVNDELVNDDPAVAADLAQGPPIDHRPRGRTAPTKPAPRPGPGRRSPGPVRPPSLDPGPPPF